MSGLRAVGFKAYSEVHEGYKSPTIGYIWVFVKIMVPFWVPNIVRHLLFRVPKRDPSFENHPYNYICIATGLRMSGKAESSRVGGFSVGFGLGWRGSVI